MLLKNFVAAAVFSVSHFLNVVEEFRSCLSKPEGSVCHFGLSIGRAVMTAVCYIFGFHYYSYYCSDRDVSTVRHCVLGRTHSSFGRREY